MAKNIIHRIKNLKRRLGKWFWVITAVAAVLLIRVFTASGKPMKIESVKVSRGDVVKTVSTSGTVKADRFSQLTFPAGGRVVAVGVKQGQKVWKGQFIAQVDSVALNAAYEQALNNRRSTQAAVDSIHDQLKNNDSDETFAEKATRTAAEVANDNAWNALMAAEDNLRNAVIYAPFTGIIDTVNPSSPGVNVLPGTANYTIVDPSSTYFDAEVEETDLPNLSVGEKVNMKLDAYPSENISGTVESIGMVAFTSSTGGNAYHVRISLPDNINQKYRIGMQGDSDIIFGTVADVLKVSSSAIFSEADKSYVWRVENGSLKKTGVEVGAESADETEIKSGLSEGNTVVDNPLSNLKDGQKVSI